MRLTRKKYIVDKKFQYGISFRAILLPLATLFIISALLLYYTGRSGSLIDKNNRELHRILENHDRMINLFLSTPELQHAGNETIAGGVSTFRENISGIKEVSENSTAITKNNSVIFYFIIAMAVIQTLLVFMIFIVISHRVSGPLHVMMSHMKEIQNGGTPEFRPLRKGDELKDFYLEFRKTINIMQPDIKPEKK